MVVGPATPTEGLSGGVGVGEGVGVGAAKRTHPLMIASAVEANMIKRATLWKLVRPVCYCTYGVVCVCGSVAPSDCTPLLM